MHPPEVDRRAGFILITALQLDTAKDRTHAGHQFAQTEWLGQIIVGTNFQPQHAVGFVGTCGEHHDWHRRTLTQPSTDCQAVQAGEHPVEDDKIRGGLGGKQQRGLAIVRDNRTVAFAFELAADERGQLMFIFNN